MRPANANQERDRGRDESTSQFALIARRSMLVEMRTALGTNRAGSRPGKEKSGLPSLCPLAASDLVLLRQGSLVCDYFTGLAVSCSSVVVVSRCCSLLLLSRAGVVGKLARSETPIRLLLSMALPVGPSPAKRTLKAKQQFSLEAIH